MPVPLPSPVSYINPFKSLLQVRGYATVCTHENSHRAELRRNASPQHIARKRFIVAELRRSTKVGFMPHRCMGCCRPVGSPMVIRHRHP